MKYDLNVYGSFAGTDVLCVVDDVPCHVVQAVSYVKEKGLIKGSFVFVHLYDKLGPLWIDELIRGSIDNNSKHTITLNYKNEFGVGGEDTIAGAHFTHIQYGVSIDDIVTESIAAFEADSATGVIITQILTEEKLAEIEAVRRFTEVRPKKSSAFKIGDVVRLKSGGPDMVVHSVQADWIGCKYYADYYRDVVIPPLCLILV